MKKKIALFANGWSGDNLQNLVSGISRVLPENSYDIFIFLGHATYAFDSIRRKCEAAIYGLPDLSNFDAAIIFGISLNCSEVQEYVYNLCLKSDIPVISIGVKRDGCCNILVENYTGMRDLCEHLVVEHKVKKVFYVAGSKEHPDSVIRQRAIEDTLRNHGLSLNEDQIYYSNWEIGSTAVYFEDNFNSLDELPDAIICANDILAEIIINALFRKGIMVPDDVIVTGFDMDPEGQIFFPSLSTVSQNLDKLGERAAEVVLKLETESFETKDYIVECSFSPSGSCGCEKAFDVGSPRILYLRQLPMNREYIHRREGRLHDIEMAISSAEKYEDLSKALQDVFFDHDGYEGDSFHVLIDPSYGRSDSVGKRGPGVKFPQMLDVLVSKEDSVPFKEEEFETYKLIPGYKHEGPNHIYTFVTLYMENRVYGYVVMRDHIDYLHDMVFRKFSETIIRNLEFCKKNIQLNSLNAKLSELMNRDALTSVKNRTAYETYVTELLALYEKGKCKDFAVAMFDINDLKKINDQFGHEKGDVYLKNCCRMICDYFKHSPIFRIGGDEFVSILTGGDYNHREEILTSMRNAMKSMELCFLLPEEKVSIASGMADFTKDSGMDIREVFQKADQAMYENKREMKAKL